MPMELQVDRLRLPMGRYRLKEDKVVRLNENEFIGNGIVKVCYLEGEQRLSESGEPPMI